MKDYSVNLKPEDDQYSILKHGDMISNDEDGKFSDADVWERCVRATQNRRGETIPVTTKVGYCRRRLDGHPENVS